MATPIWSITAVDIKRVNELKDMVPPDMLAVIDAKLDEGTPTNQIFHGMLARKGALPNAQGLTLAHLDSYNKLRRQSRVTAGAVKASLENTPTVVNALDKPLLQTPIKRASSSKLKTELEALDLIIEMGWDTLQAWKGKPIAPKTMMEAIKLKNDITAGGTKGLTQTGFFELIELERQKYVKIMTFLLGMFPEKKQQDLLQKIDEIEELFYYSTPYYDEFIEKCETLSPYEKQQKIDRWKEDWCNNPKHTKYKPDSPNIDVSDVANKEYNDNADSLLTTLKKMSRTKKAIANQQTEQDKYKAKQPWKPEEENPDQTTNPEPTQKQPETTQIDQPTSQPTPSTKQPSNPPQKRKPMQPKPKKPQPKKKPTGKPVIPWKK